MNMTEGTFVIENIKHADFVNSSSISITIWQILHQTTHDIIDADHVIVSDSTTHVDNVQDVTKLLVSAAG